jgi:hypothetical protein
MIDAENVITGAVGLSLIAAVGFQFATAYGFFDDVPPAAGASRDRPRTNLSLAVVLPLSLQAVAGLAMVFGALGGPGFQFNFPGWAKSSVPASSSEIVLPTRMAAGPNQYPPRQFKAYGIVAFKTRPTSSDRDRYDMICDAYKSSLPYYKDVKALPKDQMVTVWPVESNSWADRINEEPRERICADAVPHYGLAIALEAIDSAKKNGAALDGQGPFLLAWSPGSAKGQPDALVLVADMSDVINNEQSKQIFAQWALDIQNDPSLWDPTWNMEKLRLRIQLWADKWGTRILNTYKSKS